MRVVFFGTSEFAVPALRAIAQHVVLVVCQPDRPSGRGMKMQACPVKKVALELGLPVETPEKARDLEFVAQVEALQADVHVVAAYGQILSVKLLETARNGGINLHGSILPEYRGAAPIQRAIADGKTETGVTLMQMAKGMDTGDMIDIVRTPIGPDETYGELQTRLSLIAAQMIKNWLPRLCSGEYPREVQNEELATHAAKVSREETELSFTQNADVAYRRFRAFTPNPSVYISTNRGRLKLKAVSRSNAKGGDGEILSVAPLIVGFSDVALQFDKVQPEGKPEMTGEAWANGQRLSIGDSLLMEL
ncbi:MAG TPA: methionyl-tRNA formyltransferase [Fimbriimonas sp.]|nr:methionyl-tRNA formyltransferase [Fimbriimonas sp.]